MHTLIDTAPRRPRAVTLIAVLASMLVVILACGESATTTSGSGVSSSSNQATQPSAPKTAKVGDTITINGVATTLTSVKQLQSAEFDPTPAAGQGYYVLHIKQTNNGSDPADYNAFEFKVLAGTGSTVNQTFLSAEPNNKLLGSGQIAKGGSVEGDLVYELGTSDHKAALIWQPSFDNSLDHAWNLGL